MRADYLSYKKASGVSVLGSAMQILFTVVTLIYGVLSSDQSAISASIFMGVGIFAWLTLAIVYDQHRRERIEAMEAESLATSGTGSSVFDSKGEEFRVAARRLAGMYKFFLPAVSLILAAALIGFGIWRFTSGKPFVAPGSPQTS